MKRFTSLLLALTGLTAKVFGQIDFANTTFTGITAGQSWTIYWADGNGSPVSLSVVNQTWSSTLFSEIPESPMSYTWTVPDDGSIVAGNYQLQLMQDNNPNPVISDAFAISIPSPATSATATTVSASSTTSSGTPFIGATVTSTVTVDYIFFDMGCGCTKSTSGPSPAAMTGTAQPVTTTYVYYEEGCGCTKSTVIPVSMVPANYTAPLSPPVPSTTVPTTSSTPAPVATTFAGAANGKQVASSFLGLVLMGAAAFML